MVWFSNSTNRGIVANFAHCIGRRRIELKRMGCFYNSLDNHHQISDLSVNEESVREYKQNAGEYSSTLDTKDKRFKLNCTILSCVFSFYNPKSKRFKPSIKAILRS